MSVGITKAEAYPTKAFFVRMITRDISLEDCILDLIDNSVDEAWSQGGSRPIDFQNDNSLEPYHIEINATSNLFTIKDNCGGLSLDNAANHAFSFGRDGVSASDDFSIGVYGIGMKRAVFKIGANIRIRSTFKQNDGSRLPFAVLIDVPEWLKNNKPPWDFDIVDDEALSADGVEIVVSALTPSSSASFGSPAFIEDLKRSISRAYSLHLQKGLTIKVNGIAVKGWSIQLRQSEQYIPIRVESKEILDGDEISIEIIGGMAAPPPDAIDPDESNEGDRRFGWYVVCNGRVVLAADKTATSGWGSDDWPLWHYQYAGFIGIVSFTAKNAAALPLTTTKRSVDTSSEIYRRARGSMRSVSKAWIAYTNQRKHALDEAKTRENVAKPVPISSIARNATVTLPTLTAKITERSANVGYSVPLTRMKTLARELGNINMAFREVGLRSFDFTFKEFVGDE